MECKAVMVFFHYCVVSNYFWLFIEGLYLFTLLVETFFPERRYFYWYIIIGWGRSLIVAWTGSGPMSRMSFVPPSGSISQRREAEGDAALTHSYGILLDPGYFLALLLVESLPAEGGDMHREAR